MIALGNMRYLLEMSFSLLQFVNITGLAVVFGLATAADTLSSQVCSTLCRYFLADSL